MYFAMQNGKALKIKPENSVKSECKHCEKENQEYGSNENTKSIQDLANVYLQSLVPLDQEQFCLHHRLNLVIVVSFPCPVITEF